MRLHASLFATGLAAVVGVFALTGDSTPTTRSHAAATSPAPAQPRYGHLVLQVEGTVNRLAVTGISPKASGYNKVSIKSPFAVDLVDARGQVLGSYPLDLSAFDTNPKNVGKGVTVQGCEVRDTRIAALINVPWSNAIASLRLRSGERVIGTTAADRFTAMVQEGDVR